VEHVVFFLDGGRDGTDTENFSLTFDRTVGINKMIRIGWLLISDDVDRLHVEIEKLITS
jgi:hypothetical protein